ncbi:MAG: amidohydrolase/deacetylase family metallohydrolase [Rhodospirillaceae bacterium]|nr:amidohydrolase/deacetylase family metallohydrolase [Rhodospirillaceae bacterium]MBT6307033.1 amidohydrolase/deacetylase family metallohydrolase [Rhodospirillaceae bacterium]MDG1274016.1 amidohydrolase/deacetylase family metallohydrolase [Alphaproteobacteria bacterium]MDG1886421.1 amidohydrolase/deacetylase family metallohydrolase [Alphaproteobacteria bacterium]|tara:strand:- start:783 stop:1928 length:1146 start_codon:yes stop_codon:yes gene_type:complete
MAKYDLLLTNGRILDPSQDIDSVADIAFKNGKVLEIATTLDKEKASQVRDVSGNLVTPGLIDLHTHIYWGGTSIGVDPTDYARRCGTTTMIDAGTAGAGNFAGFKAHIIEPCEPRILAYLNISFAGIFAFSDTVMVGESEDIRLLHPRACLNVAKLHKDFLVGIKVRVGAKASGSMGYAPLDIALEVAEEAGLPVMCHLDWPPPNTKDVVNRLRPGDVLTHCFRPFPGAPTKGDGAIKEEIIAARERGVIFDIGHGVGSFGFATAETMLKAGFLPDAISSDVHSLSIKGPAYDQLVTLSKFLHLGMELKDIIAASTTGPAKAIRRPDLGTLLPGSIGDATILKIDNTRTDYVDSLGETRTGDTTFKLEGIVLNGSWWHEPD